MLTLAYCQDIGKGMGVGHVSCVCVCVCVSIIHYVTFNIFKWSP